MLKCSSIVWRQRARSSRRQQIRPRRLTCSPSCPRSRKRSRPKYSARSGRRTPVGRRAQTADELRGVVERGVEELAFAPDLGTLARPMRYALAGGGKRLRPVLCLPTAEALGVTAEHALP